MSALRTVKMLALGMILATTMAVPADGQKKVSGEIAEPQRQPLDLKGQWKAVVYWKGRVIKGQATLSVCWKFNVRVSQPKPGEDEFFRIGTAIDEGNGKLHIGPFANPGIYEQDGDQLRICFSDGQWRPTAFRADEEQTLLVLHRVKFRK
jgi:hypothetical protein